MAALALAVTRGMPAKRNSSREVMPRHNEARKKVSRSLQLPRRPVGLDRMIGCEYKMRRSHIWVKVGARRRHRGQCQDCSPGWESPRPHLKKRSQHKQVARCLGSSPVLASAALPYRRVGPTRQRLARLTLCKGVHHKKIRPVFLPKTPKARRSRVRNWLKALQMEQV